MHKTLHDTTESATAHAFNHPYVNENVCVPLRRWKFDCACWWTFCKIYGTQKENTWGRKAFGKILRTSQISSKTRVFTNFTAKWKIGDKCLQFFFCPGHLSDGGALTISSTGVRILIFCLQLQIYYYYYYYYYYVSTCDFLLSLFSFVLCYLCILILCLRYLCDWLYSCCTSTWIINKLCFIY